ncbi:MAG: hypothetical protein IKB73_06520, partial [Ruminococcus sp.]|nr:hypothetical protein [Ruminococcus sp.]
MKKNFIKRLTATVLTLCMAASLIPLSTISSSAAINAESFDRWSTTQLYSRGYGATSTILNCLAKASGSETVQSVTSLIDKYILQSDTTGDQLSAIQDTCDKILESTKDTQHIVEDINKKISQQTINASSKEANAAYKEQVTDYLTHHDESIYDFYNVYLAYTDYLQYAISDDAQQNKDKIIEKEKNYLDELSEFYASQTGKYWDSTTGISQYDFYKSQIYTTNTLDICFSGILNSLLNNMDPNSYAVEKGERFIDCAAQYAYYAYPFSSEQAQFMDYAVEYQINAVTTVLMLYQDFIAHRAEYFEELSVDEDSRATYNNAWDQLIGYYDKSVNKYTKSITNFLNSDIVLKDVGAKTTLDKYLREQSATNRFEDEKRSFSLDNTNYID